MAKSNPEELFLLQCRAYGLPEPVGEHRFAAEVVGLGDGFRKRMKESGLRDWRFDFCWPGIKFAVEVQGGIHIGGRHARGVGIQGDLDKAHSARQLGWDVYWCSSAMVREGRAIELVKDMLELKWMRTKQSHHPLRLNTSG